MKLYFTSNYGTEFGKRLMLKVLDGKNILVVAHGNSIRSLMKYIESISDEEISNTEMILGEILVYQLDKEGKQISKEVIKIDTTPTNA